MDAQTSLSPPTMEPSSEKSQPAPPPISTRDYSERLGHIYPIRQLIPFAGGGLIGLAMGASLGSKNAALRFRAENAHRLPTTHKGWYLYHKSKNYHAMWAGLKEGARMSAKLAFWGSAFVAVEERVDCTRGSKDALSSVISGLACAGAFSAWNRFPLVTTAQTVKMTLLFSLGWGLLQDMQGLATGREVGYVSFVKRRVFGTERAEAVGDTMG